MMMDVATSRRIFSKTGLMEILDGVWGAIYCIASPQSVKRFMDNGKDFKLASNYLGVKVGSGLKGFIARVKSLWKKSDELEEAMEATHANFLRRCK